MSLEGKVAVVTGGARGIGKAIAKQLAGEGAKVVIVNRRAEAAEAAKAEFAEAGLEIESLLADVSVADEVDALIKTVTTEHGTIDILVNNAGITRDNWIFRLKEEDWDAVIAVNLKGTYNCIRAVCKPMMRAKGGRIINITSVVGLTGNASQANYAASKAGVVGLTKSAAKELSRWGVTVNAVAPGYIQTDMTAELTDDAKEAFLTNIPLARPGTGEDIAAAVSFLAGDSASYVTGQTLNVDGGMVM
jgi:3-oxoacyl-[acyl-carrier protein] reductase